MQIKVTFLNWDSRRASFTENLECRFKFSVIDTSLIGTPRESPSVHTVDIIITDYLMDSWGLIEFADYGVSADMLKVVFQVAEEYITEQLRKENLNLEEKSLPPYALSTENSPLSCPYNLSNIPYPEQTAFTVDIEKQDIQSLEQCLKDFAYYIRSEKRMTFWQTKDGNKKKKIWIRRPESRAKDLLQTFLSGRYGDTIFQFEEIAAGAGKVDVFVIWSDRERAVIELKMCGHGYSLNYAKEGREQLVHYMKNKKAQNGYLVVFDSRVNDFSQGIPAYERIGEMEISVLSVDVRPYVKQKDAPSHT